MDDQIRALADSGGVMGVGFYDKFIHQHEPSMDRLMDQVEHVIALVGPDHIGIGSDFDGLPDEAVPIPAHVGRLVEFTEAMVSRGFDDETILKVLGGNFLRVVEEVWG
jgi:membrane dipeptidase